MLESSEVGLPLPGRGDVLVQVGAARTYPLDEAADALRYVAAGHTRGQVVITV